MRPPFFSVVIPVYNRAHLVLSSLQSVQQQSFTDWECIVVDDGSNDSNELKALVDGLGDDRFRYLRRANGGGAAARNTGIDAAFGQYIALLDSDDTFLPGKLDQDFIYLSGSDSGGHAAFCAVLLDRGVGASWVKPRRGPHPNENISEYLACRQGFIPTSSVVIARETASTIRYDESLLFGQDTDFALRLAAGGTRIVMLEKPLVQVRDDTRPDRISQQKKYLPILEWTDKIRAIMTPKAYLAYRGWHVARLAAPFDIRMAYRLYFEALTAGALPPALAFKALSQIAFPRKFYTQLVNSVVWLFGRR